MSRVHRTLLWASSALTGLSGVVYWWMDRMMEPADPWAVVGHPLQPWVLKAHILVAPVLVFALGLVAAEHVWKHLRARVRRGRPSGLLTLAVIGPMVLSGYLVQALTDALWLEVVAWLHIGTGVAYLGGLALHWIGVAERRVNGRRRGPSKPIESGA